MLIGRVDRTAIPGRNVKATVGTELDTTPVMAALQPGDHFLFGLRKTSGWICISYLQPNHTSSILQRSTRNRSTHHVTKIAIAIFSELGMKGKSIKGCQRHMIFFFLLLIEKINQIIHIEKQIGLIGIPVNRQGKHLSFYFRDKHPFGTRCVGQDGGAVKTQLREDPLCAKGQRRFGTTLKFRACPLRTTFLYLCQLHRRIGDVIPSCLSNC